MSGKRAVILLSGGLDSATVVAMAKSEGFTCYSMSFDYGQRHRAELQAAEQIARQLEVVEHKVIGLNLARLPRRTTSCYAFDFNFIVFLLQ